MSFKIAIYTQKGGAGKSSIAVSLKDYFDNFKVVSNDFAGQFHTYPFYEKVNDVRDVRHDGVLVYDFGGFLSPEIIDVVAQCDVLLIPTKNDDPSYLAEMVSAAEELEEYCSNIIFVINESDTSTVALDVIQDTFKDKYFSTAIRFSKGFKNGLWSGKTITEMQKAGGKDGYTYRNVVESDIQVLADAIKIVGDYKVEGDYHE